MLSPVNEHHNSFIHYEPRLTDIVMNEPIFIAEDAAHETDTNFRGLTLKGFSKINECY